MKRMIIGSIIVIFTIVSFIIGFVALYDPILLLSETLSDAYPTGEMFTSGETVQNILVVLPTFFISAIAVGIIMTMIWYMMWGHKKEYERY
jgi:hypothetical protein